MPRTIELPHVKSPPHLEKLREEVRQFIAEELKAGSFEPECDALMGGYNPEFTKKLAQKKWLGMTLPKEYGGHGRTALERFVVIEELLAAGTPLSAHWIADRQSAPLLVHFGTEEQKQKFIPLIVKGELYFSVGLSEPNSGSDLASLSCSAKKVEGGWVLNGSKTWTSGAHHSHYMITLCRTSPRTENKHEGLSQLLVDLTSMGITIRPIYFMNGDHHFNEVIFEDVFIPDNMVIGRIGYGWQQANTELAYERSGPERYLSTYPLLIELIRVLQEKGQDERVQIALGELTAQLWTLRKMSFGVAMLLEDGANPHIEAALVKDLGTRFEQNIVEAARSMVASTPSMTASTQYTKLLTQALFHSTLFTLRGGTTEIMRGIIARGLVGR
ncbi:acyl-CoA dehydrogenase family protein [Neobacillus sp. NRS-1170]|uniref:acyl-CoA dehydrogenase family protein n=1 Tax=Neobacillus sp. NRS-1170 TaxID=3233898 RepID=UPI003D26AD29